MSPSHSEIMIIGGGVVGLSVAMGLLLAGRRVHVLDGADSDARASQGNFGLVWGQGKGWDFAPYAQWTNRALAEWPAFARNLTELSGIDVALDQCGKFGFAGKPLAQNEFTVTDVVEQTFVNPLLKS